MSSNYNPDYSLRNRYMPPNQYNANNYPRSNRSHPIATYSFPSPASQHAYNGDHSLSPHINRPPAPSQRLPLVSDSFRFAAAPDPHFLRAPTEFPDSVRWSPAPSQSILRGSTGPIDLDENIINPIYSPNLTRAAHSPEWSDSRRSPAPYHSILRGSTGPIDLDENIIHPTYLQNLKRAAHSPELSDSLSYAPAPPQLFSRASTSLTDSTDPFRITPAPGRHLSNGSSPLPDSVESIRFTRSSNQPGPALRKSSPAPPPIAKTRSRPVLCTPLVFTCAIYFTIYCPDKKPNNKDRYVCYRQPKGCSIKFNPNQTSWEYFRKIVKEACSVKYKNMGLKIDDGTNSNPPTITWSAYILRNEEWSKSEPKGMADESTFQDWMREIVMSRRQKGGILLTMENPEDMAKQARKNDLLTKHVLKRKARQSGLSLSDSQRRARGSDLDTEELKRTPGVTIDSPPSSMKYESRSLPSPRKGYTGAVASIDPGQLAAIASAITQAHVAAQASLAPPVRDPSPVLSGINEPIGGLPHAMSDYLDFAGV
ncbi:hypothetical protein PtB15_5B554 [Puccinia triticina]|nr:hypothetical protein PtB15_5B554 [Puccinia triticina]